MTLSGLAPSTAYSMTVKAIDAAGNVSAASDPVTFTTLPRPAGAGHDRADRPGYARRRHADLDQRPRSPGPPSTDAVGVASYQIIGGPTVVTSTTPTRDADRADRR